MEDSCEQDHYAALGVPQDASNEEIKIAYKKLAMKYHPDKNKGDKTAEDTFKKVSSAYDILGDAEKRQQYDNPQPDPEDLLRQMFGGMGVGMSFGFGGIHMRRPTVVRVKCTLEELHHQAMKTITFERKRGGRMETKELHIKLQPGMRHGIQVGVNGEGSDDSPNRQLIIAIDEVPHKLYRREGDMLVHVKPLTLKQALLGVTIELETLDKQPLNLFLPGVIPLDHRHVIENKGMYNRGPIVIVFDIQMPKGLTPDQQDLVRKALP